MRLLDGIKGLVGPREPELIDDLVRLAHGKLDLVQEAIRADAEKSGGAADLERVVEYIVRRRDKVGGVAA